MLGQTEPSGFDAKRLPPGAKPGAKTAGLVPTPPGVWEKPPAPFGKYNPFMTKPKARPFAGQPIIPPPTQPNAMPQLPAPKPKAKTKKAPAAKPVCQPCIQHKRKRQIRRVIQYKYNWLLYRQLLEVKRLKNRLTVRKAKARETGNHAPADKTESRLNHEMQTASALISRAQNSRLELDAFGNNDMFNLAYSLGLA